MTETMMIDPAVAGRASLGAELASLENEAATYSLALDTIAARIQKIRVEDQTPIEDALREIRKKADDVRSRLALLEYEALGPTDEHRAVAFSHLQQAAVGAYHKAMRTPAAAARAVVQRTWDEGLREWQASALRMTAPPTARNGVLLPAYSQKQRSADHLAFFLAIKVELDRLAALPIEQQMSLVA